LQNVALALQESMVRLLRMAATWMAVDGSGIVVLVNTDFRKDDLLTQDLVQLATLVNMGLMAKKDVFFCLKKAKRTQFETFEEWSAHTDEFGLVSGVNVNENGQ